MRSPSVETEDKYLAEIPALPGCRAWGDTRVEALDHIHSVAVAFLESYKEHCDGLPHAIVAAEATYFEPCLVVVNHSVFYVCV